MTKRTTARETNLKNSQRKYDEALTDVKRQLAELTEMIEKHEAEAKAEAADGKPIWGHTGDMNHYRHTFGQILVASRLTDN